jgi:hypothetical protein
MSEDDTEEVRKVRCAYPECVEENGSDPHYCFADFKGIGHTSPEWDSPTHHPLRPSES